MITYKVQLVTADGNTYPVCVEKDQHILDAAMESNLNLPYTCYQPWSVTSNYKVDQEVTRERYLKSDINKTASPKQNSQDLLEILLKEEKKKRVIRNLKLHRNVNTIN